MTRAKRVCIEPQCPRLTTKTRCVEHERTRDRARGGRQERGYGANHDRARADYQRQMGAGVRFTCWRCAARGVLHQIDPTSWHLGHCDDDRSNYHGPECVAGNTATAGRRGCPHPTHVAVPPGPHLGTVAEVSPRRAGSKTFPDAWVMP